MGTRRNKTFIGLILALCLVVSGCVSREPVEENPVPVDPAEQPAPSNTYHDTYADPSAYYGMLEFEDELLFLPFERDRLDKVYFDTQEFEAYCDMVTVQRDPLNPTSWSGTIYDGVLYYSTGKAMRSVDLSTGVEKGECGFSAGFQICGSYEENGARKIVVLDAQSHQIHYYDIETGRISRSYGVPKGLSRYMTSDADNAYFCEGPCVYKLALETGELTLLAQNKSIDGPWFSDVIASDMNRGEVYNGYFYFMVSGRRYGAYRVPIDGGEVKQIIKAGFSDEIMAFCIENGVMYVAAQSEVSGHPGFPDYLGTYSVYAFDPDTLAFEQISEEIEIAEEIEGIAIKDRKAIIFGGNQTFVNLYDH